MRLKHLGFSVSVIGETITDPLKKDEILFVVSGSGGTESPAGAADIAKKVGAKVMCATSFPDSRIGRLSDIRVIVPGRVITEDDNVDYFSRTLLGIHEPLAPLGTMFELSTAIVLDTVVARLMKVLNISEDELKKRHANVEIEST